MDTQTTPEEYISPTDSPVPVLVDAPIAIPPGALALVAEDIPSVRRIRLLPSEFVQHGYTAGCPGCVPLQPRGGNSANHIEQCRLIIEEALSHSVEGRARKARELGNSKGGRIDSPGNWNARMN